MRAMEKSRVLLVPEFTELEWTIKPRLEEWAEVASFDAPGVGEESLSQAELEQIASDGTYRHETTARRGLEEVDGRGWDRFFVVSDSGANPAAGELVRRRPEAVPAVALGHACLTHGSEGPRAPINAEIASAMEQLASQDHERFIQHAITQLTGGSYDEALSSQILERVPRELLTRVWLSGGGQPLDVLLGDLDVPLLLVQHEGCLMYTEEGFEDAVEAFPSARSARVADKPSVSDEFADLVRDFCQAASSN
jgi:hypothetical protein